MQESDPVSVVASGGKLATNDDRDTPDILQVNYRFPKWILNWEHRFNNPRGLDGGKEHGAEFIGDHGSLIVDRAGYRFYPYPPDREGPHPSEWAESTHWQNFLDCVRTRNKPASDIESMAKTTIVCHLGNVAFQSGRILTWDAARQDVAHPREVKHCVSNEREYRSPWRLKHYG